MGVGVPDAFECARIGSGRWGDYGRDIGDALAAQFRDQPVDERRKRLREHEICIRGARLLRQQREVGRLIGEAAVEDDAHSVREGFARHGIGVIANAGFFLRQQGDRGNAASFGFRYPARRFVFGKWDVGEIELAVADRAHRADADVGNALIPRVRRGELT